MKKGLKRKNDLSSDENMIECERVCKKHVTKMKNIFHLLKKWFIIGGVHFKENSS